MTGTGISLFHKIYNATQVRTDQAKRFKACWRVEQDRLCFRNRRARAGGIVAGRSKVKLGGRCRVGLVTKKTDQSN